MSITATVSSSSYSFIRFRVELSDKPSRGFGPKKPKKPISSREEKGMSLQQRKSTTKRSGTSPSQAPGLSSRFGRKSETIDIEFEERLEAIRRSALEQKKADEIKQFGPIDYDAPVEPEKKTVGLGIKIGVGVAVLVFGLVFALGDFLPSGSDSPPEEVTVADEKLSEEDKATLQTRLKQYEATLDVSPKDPIALEGAAVTLAELGDYTRAASLLQDLLKEKPTDPDVFGLLGEVKYKLKDYEGSAAAYRISAMASKNVNFEVLRGFTNALLAAKKPEEAVQILLVSREHLNSEKSGTVDDKGSSNALESGSANIDPVQVDLLLGKAYSDWGHVSDAVSVYDQLISSHPNDFRGYLAKARFFAPEKAKALVDRYARK